MLFGETQIMSMDFTMKLMETLMVLKVIQTTLLDLIIMLMVTQIESKVTRMEFKGTATAFGDAKIMSMELTMPLKEDKIMLEETKTKLLVIKIISREIKMLFGDIQTISMAIKMM